MSLKKITLLLVLIITSVFVFKPHLANAATFYGCTGNTSATWLTYTCSTLLYYPYNACTAVSHSETKTCFQDPAHGTTGASTYPCGGCVHIGTYGTCSADTTGCYVGTTNVAGDAEQCGNGNPGIVWSNGGCGVTCNGYYACLSGLAYYTAYTGSGGGGSCTSTGVRAPSADYLCGTTTPPPSPSNLSATQVCTGTPNYTFNWTKGTSTDTTNLYYCDQTYAQAHGVTCTAGVDVSGDGSRAGWYLLWNGSSVNPPQSIPTTTSAWPWGAPGTTPLTIGDLYRWQVSESNGTTAQGADFTAASCSVAVNGVCAATHYSCTVGTSANNVDGTTQWTWSCIGANGGTTASCSESKPAVNGVCAATHYNCNAGTSSGSTGDTATQWNWNCVGAIGGTTAACTQTIPAPTCSGGALTATPNQIYVGGNPPPATSALSIAGCVTGSGTGVPSYTWSTPTQGAIAQVNAATTTYTPPAAWSTFTQINVAPSVSVCNPGGGACTNFSAALTLLPTFRAAGQVYIDTDNNGEKCINGHNSDGSSCVSESNYTGTALSFTICQGIQTGGCLTPYTTITTNTADGTFNTANSKPLLPGQYTAILTLPSGYEATGPKPPVAVFTVGNASTGTPCQVTAPASCDGSGNVQNLNFGILNESPWIQIIGGDISGSGISNPSGGGFTDDIPVTADPACSYGPYAVAPGTDGTTHGVIYTGSQNPDFGGGMAAAAQSWIVGGNAGNYPYTYNLPVSGGTNSSYTNLTYLVHQSDIATTALAGYCGGGGLGNCQLPATVAGLPSGVYTVDGDLTLNGASGSYTFPAGGDYVILVNGMLTINTKVHVPSGTFLLFSTSGDINVTPTVGDTAYIMAPNLEGYYSTDKSFNVLGKDPNGQGANCATNDQDLRLNMAGSVVVNADTANNGGFYYYRDLCLNDKFCPVFTLSERPDFLLNAPSIMMFPRRVWQEVAP